MNQLEHTMAATDMLLLAKDEAEAKRRSNYQDEAREIKFWQGVDEDTHEDDDDE